MANHTNDHSHELTTTVAVREEVDRALGPNFPGKQRQEVVQKVEQIIERYSSPYPDPQYLGQIEKLCPGATKDIIAASIEDLQHRHKIEAGAQEVKREEISLIKGIAQAEVGSVKQGRWLGFAAYIACLIFSGVMFYLGSEHLALAGFGAAALGIIAQLIRGGGSSSFQMTAEQQAEEDAPAPDPKQKRLSK